MARVDALPEGAKEVLRTGSAIEREFSHELIRQVMGLPQNELLSSLAVLKDAELIYERGIFPNSSYVFKHALTREVVYDALLTKSKKILHEKIGNAIEAVFKDSVKEHYEVLSEHYLASQNYDKAAKYSKRVALKAGTTGSVNKAIAYTQKVIFCLEKLPLTVDAQQNLTQARTKLGLHFLNMNYLNDAKDAIEPIIDLALASQNQKIISQIFTIMRTWHCFIQEDFQKAYEHLIKALNISKKPQDPSSLAVVNGWLGQVLSFNCEFKKASDHIEEALRFQVQANNKAWISVLKGLLCLFVYCPSGDVHLAYETSREAIGIAEDLGDIYPKANAYICHGISCYGRGRMEEAQVSFLQGIYLKEKMNSYIYGILVYKGLGDAYYQTGNYQDALDQYRKAIWFMENNIVYPSWLNLCKIALARAKVMNNEHDIDLESLYSYVSECRVKNPEGRMRKYIAEILLNLEGDHLITAENWIHQAIEADKKNGLKFYLGRDYVLSAEINSRKGDPAKARLDMNKAIDIFKGCGADGWVEMYEKEQRMNTNQIDQNKADAFADRMLNILNEGALALMSSIGHRTRLFDVMSGLPPSTSEQIADAAELNERYVREWLGAMVVGRVVDYDPKNLTYRLPPEHAAFLIRTAAPDNIAVFAQYIPLLGTVEDQIVECFQKGGGVPYSAFGRFHEVMAEDSGQTVVAALLDSILPLVPGLIEDLEKGIKVLDVGCGAGRALNLMAKSFPASRFTGFDISEEAIATGRMAAGQQGLTNLRFEVKDVTSLQITDHFQLITAFDAIHDQVYPDRVLKEIANALDPNGTFLMQDIAASSQVHKNLDHPVGPLLYSISVMHCMTVSLSASGAGLGTMWGEEKAREMLQEAGFTKVDVKKLPHDFQNAFYIIQKN